MTRIAVGGKGWIAVRTVRLLASLIAIQSIDASIEIVQNRDDTGHPSWLPSLVALADERQWQIHNSAEAAQLVNSDIFISLEHDRIVNCSRLGTARAYNVHFSNLPKYRGSLTSVWPIRQGEVHAGVTLHVLTQGVDAGPLIASHSFEIPSFYTAFDLYLAYHRHGFDLLKNNLQSLLDGSYVSTPQDEAASSEFLRNSIDFSDNQIANFDRTAEEVRDHCRSLIFPPYQYPVFHERPIGSCYTIRIGEISAATPGTVLTEDRDQAIVACRGGTVCLEYAAREADNFSADY